MRLKSTDLLRVLLRERGVTYQRLGETAGCSAGFVSHLTSGRRATCSDELAGRISEVLAVPTTLLFAPAVSSSNSQSGESNVA